MKLFKSKKEVKGLYYLLIIILFLITVTYKYFGPSYRIFKKFM